MASLTSRWVGCVLPLLDHDAERALARLGSFLGIREVGFEELDWKDGGERELEAADRLRVGLRDRHLDEGLQAPVLIAPLHVPRPRHRRRPIELQAALLVVGRVGHRDRHHDAERLRPALGIEPELDARRARRRAAREPDLPVEHEHHERHPERPRVGDRLGPLGRRLERRGRAPGGPSRCAGPSGRTRGRPPGRTGRRFSESVTGTSSPPRIFTGCPLLRAKLGADLR